MSIPPHAAQGPQNFGAPAHPGQGFPTENKPAKFAGLATAILGGIMTLLWLLAQAIGYGGAAVAGDNRDAFEVAIMITGLLVLLFIGVSFLAFISSVVLAIVGRKKARTMGIIATITTLLTGATGLINVVIQRVIAGNGGNAVFAILTGIVILILCIVLTVAGMRGAKAAKNQIA